MIGTRASWVAIALTGCVLGCGPATTSQVPTTSPEVEEVSQSRSLIDAMAESGYEQNRANGARVGELLVELTATPQGELADEARHSILRIEPNRYCWDKECVTKKALPALVHLHSGDYGFQAHIARDATFRTAFVNVLAAAVDKRALNDASVPGLSELIDGMSVETFVVKRKGCCKDVSPFDLVAFFNEYIEELRSLRLTSAVPTAVGRAQEELDLLTGKRDTSAEKAAAEAAARQRAEALAEARRIAEEERLFQELQAASALAKRAALIAEQAQEKMAAGANESAPSEAIAKLKALKDSRCREKTLEVVLGTRASTREALAEVSCLIETAAAYPNVVTKEDVATLTRMFTELQTTVLNLALQSMRVRAPELSDIPPLFAALDKVPVVTKAWRRDMKKQVKSFCTGRVEELMNGDHCRVLEASEWVQTCLESDPSMKRRWRKKISRPLKKAKAWKAAEDKKEATAKRKIERIDECLDNKNCETVDECAANDNMSFHPITNRLVSATSACMRYKSCLGIADITKGRECADRIYKSCLASCGVKRKPKLKAIVDDAGMCPSERALRDQLRRAEEHERKRREQELEELRKVKSSSDVGSGSGSSAECTICRNGYMGHCGSMNLSYQMCEQWLDGVCAQYCY